MKTPRPGLASDAYYAAKVLARLIQDIGGDPDPRHLIKAAEQDILDHCEEPYLGGCYDILSSIRDMR